MKSVLKASKKPRFECAGKYSRELFHAINPTGLGLNKNIKNAKFIHQNTGIEFHSKYGFSTDQRLVPASDPYS